MKTQAIIIVNPSSKEQTSQIRAFLKALKIKFEVRKQEIYNPEFVAKIERSRQDMLEGKGTRVKREDLDEFLGLKKESKKSKFKD